MYTNAHVSIVCYKKPVYKGLGQLLFIHAMEYYTALNTKDPSHLYQHGYLVEEKIDPRKCTIYRKSKTHKKIPHKYMHSLREEVVRSKLYLQHACAFSLSLCLSPSS